MYIVYLGAWPIPHSRHANLQEARDQVHKLLPGYREDISIYLELRWIETWFMDDSNQRKCVGRV